MWLRTKIMITVVIALALIGAFLAILFTVILKDKKKDAITKAKSTTFCVRNDPSSPDIDCSHNCVAGDPASCDIGSSCINFPIDAEYQPCK